MGTDQIALYEFTAHQVCLDYLLKNFRGTGVIPGAFGVNDGDRAACAESQAIGLGAKHTTGFGKIQFFEALL